MRKFLNYQVTILMWYTLLQIVSLWKYVSLYHFWNIKDIILIQVKNISNTTKSLMIQNIFSPYHFYRWQSKNHSDGIKNPMNNTYIVTYCYIVWQSFSIEDKFFIVKFEVSARFSHFCCCFCLKVKIWAMDKRLTLMVRAWQLRACRIWDVSAFFIY